MLWARARWAMGAGAHAGWPGRAEQRLTQRGDGHRLRLAAREQRRAVRARQQPGAGHDGAHVADAAAVGAVALAEHQAAHHRGLHALEERGEGGVRAGEWVWGVS